MFAQKTASLDEPPLVRQFSSSSLEDSPTTGLWLKLSPRLRRAQLSSSSSSSSSSSLSRSSSPTSLGDSSPWGNSDQDSEDDDIVF